MPSAITSSAAATGPVSGGAASITRDTPAARSLATTAVTALLAPAGIAAVTAGPGRPGTLPGEHVPPVAVVCCADDAGSDDVGDEPVFVAIPGEEDGATAAADCGYEPVSH